MIDIYWCVMLYVLVDLGPESEISEQLLPRDRSSGHVCFDLT
jgi:hypothetical protein